MTSSRENPSQSEPPVPAPWRRAPALLLLLWTVIACFGAVDQLLAPGDGVVRAWPEERPAAERTYVLFIDSLPLSMASDPKTMPNLARFKTEAAWAKCSGSRDQITVPAVRAAFTGRDELRIFGFVRNFANGGSGFESLFDQWKASGKKILIYSDDSFDQFGETGWALRRVDSPPRNQRDSAFQYDLFHQSMLEMGDGPWDVVIFHTTFADERSHHVTPGSPGYRRAWGEVDRWIGEIQSVVQPDQNLVIMGDHGHDEHGVHAMGLAIHTFVGARGPRFARGRELPEQPITMVRYLLSWATGMPLSEAYDGRALTDALASGVPLPAAYARDHRRPAPARPAWAIAALVVLLGASIGLWIFGQRRGFRWLDALAAGFPGALVLLVPSPSWGLALGAAAALAALGLQVGESRGSARRDRLIALGAAAIAAAMVGYSHFIATHFLTERLSWYRPFARVLGPAFGVGCLVCLVLGPKWGSWLCAGAALLLLPTTNYAWGSVSAWGPLLLLVTLVHCVAGFLPRFRDASQVWTRSEALLRVLGLIGVAWVGSQHWVVVGWDFQFRRFEPLIQALAPDGLLGWGVASFVAKLVLFVRFRRDLRVLGVSAVVIGVLTAYEWNFLPRASPYNFVLILAWLGAAAVPPSWIGDVARRREYRHVLLLSGLLMAFFFLVRNRAETHLWLSPAAAALGLAARGLRALRPDVRRAGHVLLLCLGVVIAGWVSVCWSTTHMEWSVLLRHFSTDELRHHVLLFLPLLTLRYALPVLVFRLVLAAELGAMDRQQHDLIWTAYALKLGAVVAGTLGVGLAIGTTGFFLETIQQAAVLVLLGFGLIGLGWAEREVLLERETTGQAAGEPLPALSPGE